MTEASQIIRYLPGFAAKHEVIDLLAEALGNPTQNELETLIQSCVHDGFPGLWIARSSDTTVGVMRLESSECSSCVITHIATHPSFRRQQIGRKLVEFLRDGLRFAHAVAETDDDAVCFYLACGFKCELLCDSIYGVKRYKCVVHF